MSGLSFLRRLGPAFVVGAMIIGPGSVTLMSGTGAKYGYSLLWLSLLSGLMMAGFVGLFMRFGIGSEQTFLEHVASRMGRWYAAICGISMFLVASAFQFGNNLGVTAGMNALFGDVPQVIWPVVFTSVAIIFMFAMKKVYLVVEKLMTVLLVGMFCAFLINLIQARPDLSAAAAGVFKPSLPETVNWIILGGLVGTTFSIIAASFQSYLVKAKGWTIADYRGGVIDTLLGSAVYTLIGAVIMMTAAAVVYPHEGSFKFDDMVAALEGAFGRHARILFSVGFWAAAFSSFIANTLIAGVALNDGLGFGGRLDSMPTKICATLALLVGMFVAIGVITLDSRPAAGAAPIDIKITAITIGQASTLLAVPFVTIAAIVSLFSICTKKNTLLCYLEKLFILAASSVLLCIAGITFLKLKDKMMTWMSQS